MRGEPHPGGNAFEEEEVVGKEVRRGVFVSVLRRLTRTPTVHRSSARTVNQLRLKPLKLGAARPPCVSPTRLHFALRNQRDAACHVVSKGRADLAFDLNEASHGLGGQHGVEFSSVGTA